MNFFQVAQPGLSTRAVHSIGWLSSTDCGKTKGPLNLSAVVVQVRRDGQVREHTATSGRNTGRGPQRKRRQTKSGRRRATRRRQRKRRGRTTPSKSSKQVQVLFCWCLVPAAPFWFSLSPCTTNTPCWFGQLRMLSVHSTFVVATRLYQLVVSRVQSKKRRVTKRALKTPLRRRRKSQQEGRQSGRTKRHPTRRKNHENARARIRRRTTKNRVLKVRNTFLSSKI